MTATHLRKRIRDAAALDLTGLDTTGAHVFSGRVSPLKSSEMPALLVYAFVDDGSDGAGNGGPTNEHQLTLKIEGVAQGKDDLLDILDQLSLEVEQAIFAGANLAPLLLIPPGQPSTLIQLHDIEAGAAKRTGSVHMMFPLSYRTRQGDPATQV